MLSYNAPARSRGLGMTAVALGVLGLIFFWWAPLGSVMALAGVLFGVVGWVRSTHTGLTPVWAIVGTLFCLAVLAFDVVIAWGGLEIVQLHTF